MKYYETLSDAARDRLFAWMRQQDERAQHHDAAARRLSPGPGEIAVGPGAFDSQLRAVALRGFLMELRRGADPAAALETARKHCRDAICAHNAKRPRDLGWRRWEGAGEDLCLCAYRSLVGTL